MLDEEIAISSPVAPAAPKPALEALGALAGNALKAQPMTLGAATGLSSSCMTLLAAISSAVSGTGTSDENAALQLQGVMQGGGVRILASAAPGFEVVQEQQNSRVALSCPDGDKPFSIINGSIEASVEAGQRTRLWIQFPEGHSKWVHLLLRSNFTAPAEPVVALRYLFNNESEQVLLRLRRQSVVVHKEVEIPLAAQSLFVSAGLFEGKVHVYLNGVPVYCRHARHPSATSFMLDLIGVSDGKTELLVPFLAVQPASQLPFGLTLLDQTLLATGRVEAGLAAGSRSHFHETLHAVAGFPLAYDADQIRALITQERSADHPFSSVTEDLLLDRLESEHEKAAIAASRPAPILRVRGVTIQLASNPANKGISALFSPPPKEKATIVKNLSFEAYQGDIIGIIGRNGAGKTTFLKSLVGAIPISAGQIDIEDRPILLRPGAGMQPELTGRQNVYKVGLYMNMTKAKIDEIMDDVIQFAELEDHIDRPFKYYSSGMQARLVFSMATAMPHDILLLDELLSAGDMGFQQRAVERLQQFLDHSRLVMVVQHTFDFILSRCTKCLLLEKGVPIYFGDPKIATELYRELL